MFKTIVVPLDGSQLAERVLPVAAKLAAQDGARLCLVRAPVTEKMYLPAADGYGLLYPEQYFGAANAEALEYLKIVQSRQAGHGFTVAGEVVEGDPASVIVDTARLNRADLIAMSSHGYSGLTRWILGSVAERVLRAADCPVLVLRSSEPIRRILITLDGSKISEHVLEPALELARTVGASVCLLRAVPEPSLVELSELDEFETGLGQRILYEHREEAEQYLAARAEPFEHARVPASCLVRPGPAASVILKTIEEQAIDLVAIATHGRTGLRRWIYGSVTEKILHSVGCSMLVVRPATHELRLSLKPE
jgi:nucleotide-binding universal stress UspA family protein